MPLNGLIKSDEQLVSYCGLYCGECQKYIKGKCPGCKNKGTDTFWCKIKKCNLENNFKSCAECTLFEDTAYCEKNNFFIIRLIDRLYKISRKKGIEVIKERGYSGFAAFMAHAGWFFVKEEYKSQKFIERWKKSGLILSLIRYLNA